MSLIAVAVNDNDANVVCESINYLPRIVSVGIGEHSWLLLLHPQAPRMT